MIERKYISFIMIMLLVLCTGGLPLKGKNRDKKVVLDIPGGKTMHLVLPSAWRLEGKTIKQNVSRYFEITPPRGDEFKFLITPATDPTQPGKPIGSQRISLVIRNMRKAISSKAREKKIPILNLKGSHCRGQYYFATDSKPKEGEYPYLIQAAIGSENILFMVTILHRVRNSNNIQRIFQILKTIKISPAGAKTAPGLKK